MDGPFPQHGVPEHLLRWVHPVLVCVVTGDGGLLPGGGQVKGLVWGRHLVWRRHLCTHGKTNQPRHGTVETLNVQQLLHVHYFFFAINHTARVLVPYLQGRCRCSSRLQLSWDTQQTHRLVPDGRDPPPLGALGTQMAGTLQETKSVSLLKIMM